MKLLPDKPKPDRMHRNGNFLGVSIYKNNDSGTELYWGWLKTHPTITTAAFQRTQLVQEWRWGLWSTVLYNLNT